MSNFRISNLQDKKFSYSDDKIFILRKDESGYSTYTEYLSGFTIPKATESNIGGIGLHYTQNEFNYPLSADEEGRAFVYIPWTDYHVQSAWYEPSISSLVITFNDGIDAISIQMSALIEYYYGDSERTIILDTETKKFSVNTEGKYITNADYLISSYVGNEGDTIYKIDDKSQRLPLMRFDIYICENEKDIEKVNSSATEGMIEVNLMNNNVYRYTSGSWVNIGVDDIFKYCGYGRFQYNSITHKLFYTDRDGDRNGIYCVRKQREDD